MSVFSFHSPLSGHLAASPLKHHSRPANVAELVSVQAAAMPEAIAAVDGDLELTYKELDDRAKDLAQSLRILGVGPDSVVGLCLPRSVAMVVGALGILKAGAAYLPLDPISPAARIAFQLNDAQVPVMVTGQSTKERLPAGSWRVIALDREGRQRNPENSIDGSESAAVEVTGQNLAYVIYTSGSTGEPKGVEITHASLENLIQWHQQAFAVVPSDRAAQVASPGFDAAVWELWPYLTAGAAVYVPDDEIVKAPMMLRDWLVRCGITKAFVPTPMAEQLMCLEWPVNTALRFLLTGADTLRNHPPATLPFAVVNNYGPTECTVVATSGVVQPGLCSDCVPSIGRPISNVQVYILDEHLRQVPVGTPGELYIGGAGVARGYRNRPELTAERFTKIRFSDQTELRLYKTGDAASYLPDGQIAFLGRTDDQVKIRGYRIELGEVAAALNRHPMIQTSVVIAREEAPGDKRLIAYIVPKVKPGTSVELTDNMLREYLSKSLPEYMLPAMFCRMDALPLTASGKIDRNALPAPAHQLRDDEYIAPRTPAEERMTGILATLLRLERVGVNENFFLLGGNSLLGAQVIARVRDTFGVELTLLSLFDHPTVSGLSAEIERLLVAKLGAMSEDEAERLAAQLSNRNAA
ncbi:MAG TPA: non-ribosomal peptide synthetase [Candidatus Angelobacter sp.]|nr:non-ribosomal peptide synthetase [Candidatus Angelobacter sp.]